MSANDNASDNDTERRQRHTAGAFDIRNVIGALLGIYGIVLLVLGIFSDDSGENTGDLHANVWAGIALIVVAIAFIAWARVRPTVVDDRAVAEKRSDDSPAA
jgi:drug/metabolite transporter (DMT)-like permease